VANRILVVDDIADFRRALQNIIEFNGWTVCGEAADGRDAIEKAKALCPDLIVLDLSMPVMNGLEAARVLHQIMPRVPMVLCSLHANDVLQKEAFAAGVKMVISKAPEHANPDQQSQRIVRKASEDCVRIRSQRCKRIEQVLGRVVGGVPEERLRINDQPRLAFRFKDITCV
jgi:CheY-like chemotaxis protein